MTQVLTQGPSPDMAVPEPKGPEPAVVLPPRASWRQYLPAALLISAPAAGVFYAVVRLWNHGVSWFDLTIAGVMYIVTGFGITLGFHRLLTHNSFRAKRWLKILLVVAGTMALEGSPIGWVSLHRKHHVFSDKPEDPHSPWIYGSGFTRMVKGFWYAHAGWLLRWRVEDPERWSPDLIADRDVNIVSALTPVWFLLTLAFPFGIGYAVTGTLWGAALAELWAGLVRVFVLHHVTWSINSICHIFGKQPFSSRDRSTNFAPLAILSLGESWHNAHHAFPALARHGVERGQIDPSAGAIRLFERLGWASEVKWPKPELLALRRMN